MLRARPRQAAVLLFLRPIAQQFPAQLPDLLDGSRFGLIRRATLRHRLVQHVRYRMKPRQNVRASGHPLLQGDFAASHWLGFIVHEPLQIYQPPPRIQAHLTGTTKTPPSSFS